MIVSWALAWLIYAGVLEVGTCILGTAHGGRAESEGWAGVIGLFVLVTVGTLGFRSRRRLLPLFAAFVIVYAAGLLVLWAVSPAIWGSVHCTGGSF